jgi:hypothetical protein
LWIYIRECFIIVGAMETAKRKFEYKEGTNRREEKVVGCSDFCIGNVKWIGDLHEKT